MRWALNITAISRPACIAMAICLIVLTGCNRHKVTPGVLYICREYTLTFDSLVENNGIVAKAISSMEMTVTHGDKVLHHWKIDDINNRYVRTTVGMKLPDALYNMAITEIANDSLSDINPEAITLSLAYIDPELSKLALRARVKNGRVTSTPGQEWPIDVSRINWIPAAWEVYKVTGDEAWLHEFFEVAKRTLADDAYVNFRSSRGLFSGGTVPLDRASQYYPEWMATTDIYGSFSLRANALYVGAYHAMAEASKIIDNEAKNNYSAQSIGLINAINMNLWLPDKGHYSQYLYGAPPAQSPVTDNAAQALCVLYGVTRAGMSTRLMEKGAVTPYGVAAVWPCTADSADVYNKCIRPVSQGLWALAAAKTQNMEQLRPALAAIMRNTVITAGNTPYINAFTGEPIVRDSIAHNEINTAAAAGLAMTFRVLAGISFTSDAIRFAPMVPADYTEDILISGLRYRDADLSIIIHGTGSKVARFTVDGVPQSEYKLSADATGRHIIDITLTGANSYNNDKVNRVTVPEQMPPVPHVLAMNNDCDTIMGVPDNATINAYINGAFEYNSDSTLYRILNPLRVATYAFSCTGPKHIEGYTCRPILHIPIQNERTIILTDYYPGGTKLIKDTIEQKKYISLSATQNPHISFDIVTDKGGAYLLDVHYANGAGVPTEQSHCGIRTLLVNGDRSGVLIMPQLGKDEWERTTFSNFLKIYLDEGVNNISLDYVVPYNINTSGADTPVLVDYIRLIRL